jgi:hypothetical protein
MGVVLIAKLSQQVGGTHQLSMVKGGEGEETGKSELARDTDELAWTWNGGARVRGLYILSSAEGWISQGMERKRGPLTSC